MDDARGSICGGLIKDGDTAAVPEHAPKQLDSHDAEDDEVEGDEDDDVQQHGQAGDDGAHQVLHGSSVNRSITSMTKFQEPRFYSCKQVRTRFKRLFTIMRVAPVVHNPYQKTPTHPRNHVQEHMRASPH